MKACPVLQHLVCYQEFRIGEDFTRFITWVSDVNFQNFLSEHAEACTIISIQTASRLLHDYPNEIKNEINDKFWSKIK